LIVEIARRLKYEIKIPKRRLKKSI